MPGYTPNILNLSCLFVWLNENFLGGGKRKRFLFIRSFRPSNRTSNSLEKNQNSRGEEGLTILEFRRYRGVEHFGISKARKV